MTQFEFLEVLFDEYDKSCFGDSPEAYRVESVFNQQPSIIDFIDRHFFCINTLHGAVDLRPEKDWHRPDLPRRADHNVEKHRTFLLEFDKGNPEGQYNDFISTQVPFSAAVYSGGKSIHFFITLTEPVSAPEYADIAKRLHMKFPNADKSTKNPSRLARLPGVLRQDTNKMQKLIELRTRVSLASLLPHLPDLPLEPARVQSESLVSSTIILARHNPEYVMQQLGIEGRNQFFFWLGQRLIEANLPKDVRRGFIEGVYAKLQNKHQFLLREARAAARV